MTLLALSAAAEVKGKLESRIVLKLGKGDVVTSSMNDVQYVVTEYGIARLEGKSVRERAEELIKVAHPKFRKQLRAELKAQYDSRKLDAEEREARQALKRIQARRAAMAANAD